MDEYSRDYAPCAKVEESSEEGSTSTPQLSLHLNSDIDPRKQKETQSNFVSKQPQATEASRIGESNVSKSVFGDPNNVRMDLSGEPKKPGSLLSDLPPLGNHSALGRYHHFLSYSFISINKPCVGRGTNIVGQEMRANGTDLGICVHLHSILS